MKVTIKVDHGLDMIHGDCGSGIEESNFNRIIPPESL